MTEVNASDSTILPGRPGGSPLLEVRGLKVHFPFSTGGTFRRTRGVVRAVDGVSFTVDEGRTLGIVGESGCGKSTMARAILNLVHATEGTVSLSGTPILGLSESAMRPYRQQVQMIFQDPFSSLNPRMTAGRIIAEPMQIFNLHPPSQRALETMRLMDLVGLNPRYINRYPHEFSGGQCQRIGIARALAVRPKLIICDEPVSALDVSIQAQVVNLLMEIQRQLSLAYIFISHDLSLVRHIADRVAVMYLGRIVEIAPADQLCSDPQHPYTQALLSAVPVPDPREATQRARIHLSGEVPSPERVYPGCRFVDRCPIADSACSETDPPLEGSNRQVACLKSEVSTFHKIK